MMIRIRRDRGAFLISWIVFAAACIIITGALAVTILVGFPSIVTILPEDYQTWCNNIFGYTSTFISWTVLVSCISFEIGLRIALYVARWVLRLIPKPLSVGQK